MSSETAVVDWQLGDLNAIVGIDQSRSGNPITIDSPYGKAVQFDGKGDGILLERNPLVNLRQFTVEVFFRPDPNGLPEQRFLQMGEVNGDRLMMEIRLAADNQWYLDAFIKSGDSSKPLIDKSLLHPTGEWYHLAFVVDNGKMDTYVAGKHELTGIVRFSPFKSGRTSIGVRMNKVYWFKGAIARIRITPKSLTPSDFAMSRKGVSMKQPRPEHLAFNVKDPLAIAKWYVDHLGMKIYRSGAPPGNTRFVGDSAGNMMLELGTNAAVPYTDYASWNQISLHVAFMVDDIKAIRDSLAAAGAKVADDIAKTPSGDQVLMMRDPWGLAIQFVSRVNPMLKSLGLRFEHFALNVPDPQKMVNWYVENLGMKIMRKGGPPTYGSFVSDPGGNMMLELQLDAKYPVIDLSKIDHPAMHFAFVVDDVRSIRTRLIAAGATIAEELRETNAGDQVLVLRDPWGFAIQLIKRAEAMLK
jgi:catechol 2,3-dioxygenase-like lactoylglutathione lyase family enzyme